MGNLGVTSETSSMSNLRAGSHPTVEISVTIASGEGALAVGTVLGRVTASGEYAAYDNAASDGTEVARAILAAAVDATSAAVNTTAYVHGEFSEADLVGINAAGILDLLALGVYVK